MRKGIDSEDIDDVAEAQKRVMEKITVAVEQLDDKPSSKGWDTHDLASFDNKDKYARISKNASGRKTRFEFNRISNELLAEFEAFITEKLSTEE
ncbi:ParB family protein [compost metagenome]